MANIITTADGSHSLFVAELNEHYHSVHGAIQESEHVFINHGLRAVDSEKKKIRILEIGMGTGLNVFLTFLYSVSSSGYIDYTAIEPFPLEVATIKALNYVGLLKAEKHSDIFSTIHSSPWNEKGYHLSDTFLFEKVKNKIQEIDFAEPFDLVYFDAFAPRSQPEMWTGEVFNRLFSVMSRGGIIVTYCAKGEVKRTMKNSGFTVETLPGPPGKREMTKAIRR